jgi:hypothetical protein
MKQIKLSEDELARKDAINMALVVLRQELHLTAPGVVAYGAGSRNKFAISNWRRKWQIIDAIKVLEAMVGLRDTVLGR